ncbi:isopentenyl phosphate kinase [Halodesulfurarchaeum formicicum]|uniref:Isopentenyl phosphate kinase n=1 Tax=Halodesulfurarchaeum formicicum TaxID=1873524 RepID=A0A1D8S3M1_9EURY|nr:isopentenyl phosphate kinase [Halodesulfurarchaeum formicicum]AOW79954.1 isopentenyl phosphate kinase [Halodesulfurarchaeum formicicum]APE95247.1 isopentenyl phosphate kinase [Halodesulfurarchaeum formicicum]
MSERAGPVVLKLGGSVITRKDQPETVDESKLDAVAATIGEAAVDSLVIVHGGGSFGHPAAAQAGVSLASGTHDTTAISEIHAAMGRLNEAVLDALHEAGVPAVPVRPFSAGYRDESGAVVQPTGAIETMLGEGFVPVLHGDVFTTVDAGATIVSGDELVVSLAASLAAQSVGLCTTVPGVLDEDEDVIPEIERFDAVEGVLSGSDATDVTGGMAGKVRALLDLDTPAQIFDPDGLAAFLGSGAPGTRIDGSSQ